MLRIAIVDDDREMAEYTKILVEQQMEKDCVDSEAVVYERASKLKNAVDDGAYFDFFVLDIEMPGMDGLDLAKYIRSKRKESHIIFLTSHPQFAICGWQEDIRAAHYILKENMGEEFPEIIGKCARKFLEEENECYYVNNSQGLRKLLYRDIRYVKKEGKNCIFYTTNGEHSVRGTIGEIKQNLTGEQFISIDRGCIINIEYINYITKNTVNLKEGSIFEISRSNIKRVKEYVIAYWGYKA